MSSPRDSSVSSSSTGSNNPNREDLAVTSTQQPYSVAVPLPHLCHDPNAEVVALRPRTFLGQGEMYIRREEMSRSLGIPVKLLHESSGHTVTVELKSGELYRGNLLECEDNWNCQLEDITYTAKDGKVSQLEHVFIRGSKVRFIVIPDMLKNAPMFNRVNAKIKGKSSIGVGRGRPAMRGRGTGRGTGGRGGAPPLRR
ncbi:hypothetical protein YC2023_080582 [Brassica napus]